MAFCDAGIKVTIYSERLKKSHYAYCDQPTQGGGLSFKEKKVALEILTENGTTIITDLMILKVIFGMEMKTSTI